MSTNELFMSCISGIPDDLKKQVDMSFALSDKIYAAMQERGISKTELAERMGKRKSEVSKWLSGTHNFTLSTIAKISDALGCELIHV